MKELKNLQESSTDTWRKIARGEKLKNPSQKIASKKLSGYKYKIAVYIKLSPSDEIREEGSLVSHPQRIRNFINMKNMSDPTWGEIIETYTDKDLSGKNMNRPSFQRMCKDIVAGKVNAVIVTELSRLSRSVKDFCHFWDFLKEHKVKFFSLKENFDTSTAMGELMVIQAISFAQFERQTIVERTKNGIQARAERGLSNGGQRVLGYDPHPTKKCHLVVNEQERPRVEFIFNKFLELGSLTQTLKFLNEHGYKTKSFVTKKSNEQGGTRWTLGTLYSLLTNLIYLGKREFNKKNRNKNQSELSPHERYKVYDGQWPALISQELFNEVQEKLEKNKKELRQSDHCYTLSGLVYCGLCGQKLVGTKAHGRNRQYFYYSHKRKMIIHGNRHLKKCELENIPAHSLEEAVSFRIKTLSKNKDFLLELVKNNNTQGQSRIKQNQNLINSHRESLKKVSNDLDGLTKALSRAESTDTQDFLLKQVDTLTHKFNSLKEEIERLKNERTSFKENVICAENLFSTLQIVNKNLAKINPKKQKELLSNIIKKVTVYKEKLVVEYFGSTENKAHNGSVQGSYNVCIGRGTRT